MPDPKEAQTEEVLASRLLAPIKSPIRREQLIAVMAEMLRTWTRAAVAEAVEKAEKASGLCEGHRPTRSRVLAGCWGCSRDESERDLQRLYRAIQTIAGSELGMGVHRPCCATGRQIAIDALKQLEGRLRSSSQVMCGPEHEPLP